MKKCSECQLEKEDVSKNGKCKPCNTEYMRQYRLKNPEKIKNYQQEYDAAYYQENKTEILENKKEYYQENKEDILEDRKEYYQNHKDEKKKYNRAHYLANRDEILSDARDYYDNNRDSIRKYHNDYNKERRLIDPNFRLRATISASINFYLKSNGSSKNGNSCLDYLEYSIDELRAHLQTLFEPWMNWDNYGRYDTKTWKDDDPSTWKWQIDHIIPQSTLPFTSVKDENVKKCWALENLRPYSAKQNFLEGVSKIRHNSQP